MGKKQRYFFKSIFLCSATVFFCFFVADYASTRPITPDDSWKVHVGASGHIPGIAGIRVQWWWNNDPPDWTYTEIYRCDDFLPDPAPAASKPVNCTLLGGTINFSGGSFVGSWIDGSATEGKYYWYKVKICDGSSCVESDRSSYDLNNGESSHLNGAWVGSKPIAPHVPTGISVSKVNDYSVKISWTGNDPRMTDFFQLYRCTTTSMASCKHHPYYDPYHQEYKDYAFNEFYAYDGDSSDPGTNYYYRVKACAQGFKNDSSSLQCSALSSYGHTTPQSPPQPPSGLSASDGDHFHYIQIVWNPSSGADYYQLYRNGSQIAKLSAIVYIDKEESGLIQGTKYNYTVKACNAAGCSGMSNSDSGYMNTQTGASIFILLDLLLGKGR